MVKSERISSNQLMMQFAAVQFVEHWSYKHKTVLTVQVMWSPRSETWLPSLPRTSYLCVLLLCEPSSIFHCQVWYRALSLCMRALCAYSTFGHHPHPYATLVPNFVSVETPNAELACGAKLFNQSLTQSLTPPSLFDMPGTEAFASENSVHFDNCQSALHNVQINQRCRLTLSTPAVLNCCCSKGSATYWSNPPFLIFFGCSGAHD